MMGWVLCLTSLIQGILNNIPSVRFTLTDNTWAFCVMKHRLLNLLVASSHERWSDEANATCATSTPHHTLTSEQEWQSVIYSDIETSTLVNNCWGLDCTASGWDVFTGLNRSVDQLTGQVQSLSCYQKSDYKHNLRCSYKTARTDSSRGRFAHHTEINTSAK